MKELDFINIIKHQLDNSHYIGDDCAFLDDLNIFITQDTLVENVHFSLNTTSPYLLGRKSVSVNLSDIAAALAKPKYISVSVSMPKNISNEFINELYRGINDVCREFNVAVTGGDITGSEKVVISICAIGEKFLNYITSRSFAVEGDYIVVTGNFGASGIGLHALSNNINNYDELINAHLNPKARIKEALIIGGIINRDIAAMDCSDGLVDALYKISCASKHSLIIDINKVPVLQNLKKYCSETSLDYKHFVKWGAEDYELVLCLNEEIYKKIDKNIFTLIGRVQNKTENPFVTIVDGENKEYITKEIFESNSFNHFN